MRDPQPRAPFDQGLFLAHLNKGKAFYDEKRWEEAEVELEEAYLLRPRDLKVLNLLGLVYFKQDKLEKAEEVYRKLSAESPEAHTLQYNLGLIYFKLSRWEDAESSFLKTLDLGGDNAKVSFYLGSIYERQQRFQDAIFQYRQAGANLMVRRMEDKIASAPRPAAHAPAPAQTIEPTPAGQAPGKKTDDTAKFHAGDVRAEVNRRADPTMFPPRPVQPVSDVLLADGPARRKLTDTAPFMIPPGFRAAAAAAADASARFPDVIAFPTPGVHETLPPRRSETFQFLRSNLMQVDFSGKVFVKQGTIYSYSGNLTFWVKEPRPDGRPPLVIITGEGKILLTDHDREITFMHVNQETLWVEPGHLLACEETLEPRYVTFGSGPQAVDMAALEGSGMVALSVASKPLSLPVSPDLPVSVPASSVITWSGTLTAKNVEDPQVYQMMTAQQNRGPLLRLEGTGRLLVEQAPS